MKQLFEPTQLAGVTLPNRIIRSATFEGMAGNGPTTAHHAWGFIIE